MLVFLIYVLSFFQREIPQKVNADFEIKLDYKFKQRPQTNTNTNTYDPNGNRSKSDSGILPYLIVNLKVIKLDSSEVRIRVNSNLTENIIGKKITNDSIFTIDFGFMEDIKDRVTAHTYTVLFLTSKRVPVSKIVIDIDEEGNFFVNNEKRGKL